MPPAITTKSIVFENDHEAMAVFPPANAPAKEIAAALGVEHARAILLIIGGADNLEEKVTARLIQLFGRGVARAAADTDALIIDGGAESGVMKMMGQGVADRGFKSTLIGVAPLGLISYPGSEGGGTTPLDPNHSHFVLVEGKDWGDETGMIFKLVDWFRSHGPLKAHAVVLLAGGGTVSRHEALQAVRQNLPLIVVEGSGGAADEISTAWKARPDLPDDPVMAEIIADGRIELHSLSNAVKGAERLILRQLGGDNVLLQAWERFAVYDLNAVLLQQRFYRFQLTIILLGLAATALALLKQVMNPSGVFQRGEAWWFVYYILLLIPIVLTILITATNRFKQGNKWLLLRSGAEAIKREIYKYRARAGDYKDILKAPPAQSAPGEPPPPPPPTPEQVLAQNVEDVTRRVMQTEVNTSSLLPYTQGLPPNMDYAQGGDDGMSFLTPDRYVQVRLGDQLSYYRGKTVKLERKLKLIQWSIYIIGGLGTLLAAINQQVWIALTTALTAALATYLSYQQTENTLMKYNQASTDLDSVKRWWTALPAEEQGKQENVDALVEHTEKVLQSELDGWVQQMQNALAELRKGQAQAAEKEAENKEALAQRTERVQSALAGGVQKMEGALAELRESKTQTSAEEEPAAGGGADESQTDEDASKSSENERAEESSTEPEGDNAGGEASGDVSEEQAGGDDTADDKAGDAGGDEAGVETTGGDNVGADGGDDKQSPDGKAGE